MEILDCINKSIKISKGSITIKDKDNKTRGIVRDIKHFKDVQINIQSKYFRIMKQAGIWGNSKIDLNNVIIKDNEIYLFRNIHGIECLKKYDMELVKKLDSIYIKAEENGIRVIECEFV